MRSDANLVMVLAIILIFDHSSIVFRKHNSSSSPTNSVSAFKKCKQKIVAIETKKVIPVPYPVPMLMKPTKKPRPQTIVVTVPKPVYRKEKSCGSCGKKHMLVPNVGIKCPYQQQQQQNQQPILPNLAGLLPTGVTNSITDFGTTTSTITQTARQIETVMDYGLNYNYPNYNYNYGDNDYGNEPLSDNYDYGSLNDYNGDYQPFDEQPQRRRR